MMNRALPDQLLFLVFGSHFQINVNGRLGNGESLVDNFHASLAVVRIFIGPLAPAQLGLL